MKKPVGIPTGFFMDKTNVCFIHHTYAETTN